MTYSYYYTYGFDTRAQKHNDEWILVVWFKRNYDRKKKEQARSHATQFSSPTIPKKFQNKEDALEWVPFFRQHVEETIRGNGKRKYRNGQIPKHTVPDSLKNSKSRKKRKAQRKVVRRQETKEKHLMSIEERKKNA